MPAFIAGLLRCWFALGLAWQYRQKLSVFLKRLPSNSTPTLTAISPQDWYDQGLRVLVLDFDGVLSFHAGEAPLPVVADWLRKAEAVFPNALFVLTNLPTPERKKMFETQYPRIQLIETPRKKPYPDGILSLLKTIPCSPQQVLLVDDRLLTGILLAVSTGIRGCWITEPYRNFKLHPVKESFFTLLRLADQACLSLMLFL
jgi:putative phosphatase